MLEGSLAVHASANAGGDALGNGRKVILANPLFELDNFRPLEFLR
jgi:hypothetical protein